MRSNTALIEATINGFIVTVNPDRVDEEKFIFKTLEEVKSKLNEIFING
ncbi:hypothetical protein KC685_05060 [Candidatus Dojkabacteria bacterium]|uniref:Uncharacterized protein n=1 Tax=Candidatus Dojkabacteria bacterium TaxID=2099670 RepID=A0A955I5T0_9BACT|nr:hypothetical protein [Candidatus Dojkabacteria bacterium]